MPLGPCAFITPWNFPLNLVAHKIAPALACGCPFVLKPASTTPIGALMLGEILAETDLPQGAFSILPLKSSDAAALVEDERIKKLSFTGSPEVGWELRDRARKKHVTLELGGNAAVRRRARRRPRRRRRPLRLRRLLPVGPKLHQRAADLRARVGLRARFATNSCRPSRRSRWAIRATRTRSSGR